ncbi:MAG: molecular chaperone TorD family protein, partial [bacterium]
MMTSVEDLRAKGALCILTGRLLLEPPSPDLLRQLKGLGFEGLLDDNFNGGVNSSEEEIALELAEEYVRLFSAVPPYGSIYHKVDRYSGELWGSTTIQLKKYWEWLGITL